MQLSKDTWKLCFSILYSIMSLQSMQSHLLAKLQRGTGQAVERAGRRPSQCRCTAPGESRPLPKARSQQGNPARLTIDSVPERLEFRLPWACQADCGPSPVFLSPRKLVPEVKYYMVPGPSLQNSCLAGQLQHSVAKFA